MTDERVQELIRKELEFFAEDVKTSLNKVLEISRTVGEKALHLAEKIERKILDGDIPSSSNTQGVSKSLSKDIEKMKETMEELKGIYKMMGGSE